MKFRYSAFGKRLYDKLEQQRPNILNLLWQAGRLESVIFEAESHFVERALHFNNAYQSRNPRPARDIDLITYMNDREAFVSAEVDREMDVWVSNYTPNLRKEASFANDLA